MQEKTEVKGSQEAKGNHMVYRILGGVSSRERIGAGFMEKGSGGDNVDSSPMDFSIVYVLSGKGSYTDHRGRSYDISPGSCFMRFPDYRHTNTIEPGDDWRELFLAFGPQQGRAFAAMGFIDPEQPVGFIGSQPGIAEEVRELCTRLEKAGQAEIPYVFKSMCDLFLEMLELDSLGRKTCESAVLMEKICEYISNSLHERLSIGQISHKFGISAAKLRKDFKQSKGISIGSYLIRKRIEASFRYLGDAGLSIGEIAEKLGYKSIYDYSSQFKKFTGHAPSYYRKK